MRLLVVSHACSTPLNQSFYADVAAATGWEVSLVIPERWHSEYNANQQVSRWPGFQGEIHAVPVWRSGDIPLHVYRQTFVPLLRRLRPEAIYVHHEPYGLATAQVCLANRLVDRSPLGFYAAQNLYKEYPVPFRWLERWVLQEAQFCFPVSVGAQQVVRRKGFQGSAEVLPLAVDAGLYYPRREWAAEQRARLGVGADEFVVGYMGRLVEEKGLLTLLRAVKQAFGAQQRWRCVLVGSGAFEPQLRAAAEELGVGEQVIFIGYVPHEEAPKWLSLFDVLVLPSETRIRWKEQFGRILVEASACETAVLGSNSGEIPNVLADTGGGWVFAEGNVEELAGKLETLEGDRERLRQLALTGAAAVRERYDQRHLAKRFAATIEASVRASQSTTRAHKPAPRGR